MVMKNGDYESWNMAAGHDFFFEFFFLLILKF